MADAKALYKVALKEIYGSVDGMSLPSGVIEKMADVYCACLVASAITNSRDMICQKLDELTNAVKGGLE